MDCLIIGVRIRTQRRVHKRSTLHKKVSAAVLSDSRKYIPIVSNLNVITVCPDINSGKITAFVLVVCDTEVAYYFLYYKIHLIRFVVQSDKNYKLFFCFKINQRLKQLKLIQ